MNNKRFTVGFEYPLTKTMMANVYLDGVKFGACWEMVDYGPMMDGSICFNRQGLALDLKCPIVPVMNNRTELLELLENWVCEKNISPLSFLMGDKKKD